MNANRCLPLVWLVTALPAQEPAKAIEPVRFSFQLDHGMPGPKIAMRLAGLARDEVTLAMPVWKPGSYHVGNFARTVRGLKAFGADGTELAVSQPDPSRWTIASKGQSSIEVRYEVQPPRGGGIGRATKREDDKREFEAYQFEGPATWLYPVDAKHAPQQVTFDLPEGWKIATGMLPAGDGKTFSCTDYDTFADCPFRVGKFDERTFQVQGVDHRVVWNGFGSAKSDPQKLAELYDAAVARYQRIVKAQLDMMGAPPYPFYVFLINAPGGQGLEHLNSTTISMMDLSGSTPDENSIWDSIVSHEFFHLWNVTRLRPQALGPFDYQGPNRTKYLWLSEGVTSYYGDLLLVRAGVWNEELYWTEAIAGEINTLQHNAGRLKMSVAEASRTVWDAPYMRRGMSAPDYYNKGQLLGLLLDIEIRDATANKKSFDDVMRALYAQCRETGKGFADGDVARHCAAIAGRDFAPFFAKYVDGVEELPFKECLAKIGLELLEVVPKTDSRSSRPARPHYVVRFAKNPPQRAQAMRKDMVRRVD